MRRRLCDDADFASRASLPDGSDTLGNLVSIRRAGNEGIGRYLPYPFAHDETHRNASVFEEPRVCRDVAEELRNKLFPLDALWYMRDEVKLRVYCSPARCKYGAKLKSGVTYCLPQMLLS